MKTRRIPRPVDGDECEQGWCKEGIANPFLSKYLFKMPRLVGGEIHSREYQQFLRALERYLLNEELDYRILNVFYLHGTTRNHDV